MKSTINFSYLIFLSVVAALGGFLFGYSFDVLLYELLVAEIRSPYVWQMDDPLCTLQRGLFP